MKKIKIRKSVTATAVAVGLFVTLASAQRHGGVYGGGFHGGTFGGGTHYTTPSTYTPSISRPSVSYNNSNYAGRFENRNTSISNAYIRQRNVTQSVGVYNNIRYTGRSTETFNRGRYAGTYIARGGYPVRYGGGYGHCVYGYRGYGLNVFSPYGIYPFYPTLGLRLSWLPFGYYDFYWDGYPYYYYNSVFYRRTTDNQYEIVAPPIGARVNSIPSDAKVVVINGNKYYECNGTYYQEQLDANNRVVYVVIGTNGVLNQPNTPQVVHEPEVGDIVPQLPSSSSEVYLNGQKYFESPDHVYYQEIYENGQTAYKIVGK